MNPDETARHPESIIYEMGPEIVKTTHNPVSQLCGLCHRWVPGGWTVVWGCIEWVLEAAMEGLDSTLSDGFYFLPGPVLLIEPVELLVGRHHFTI